MEMILKIGSVDEVNQQQYQDGDIVEAFSNTRIHLCHAEMICHPDNFDFNAAGLRDRDTLLEKFMAQTSKYRFTRLNSNDVERLNLLTDEVDILNTVPNDKGEYMDVYQFISRRRNHSRHKIFGAVQGGEVWYGGNSARDSVVVDAVWNDIETHSANLKADHANWPVSDIEKMSFLPINVIGFKNDAIQEISSGTASSRRSIVQVEEEPEEPSVMIAKRRWQVPYWDLAAELSVNIDDVRNKSKTVDARSSEPLVDRNHVDNVNVDKVEAGIITL